jgi:hypothetical protein
MVPRRYRKRLTPDFSNPSAFSTRAALVSAFFAVPIHLAYSFLDE